MYFVFGRVSDMPLKGNGDERYGGRRTNTTQRRETVDQQSLVDAVHIYGAVLRTGNGHVQFSGDRHAGDRQIVTEERLERFRVRVV